MAAARPVSPVSALRPGRTTPNSVKRRSSRAKRGSKPARRNDDLPVPDGPNTTNSDFVSASLMPRSSSSPCTIGASRPKNTAASTCSNGSQPRYGARSTSSGGGHTNECALMPVPRMASRNRYKPRWRTSPVVRRPRRSRSCHSRRTGRTAATPTSSHHRPTARGGHTKSACSDSPRRGIQSCTHGTLPNCLTGGRPRLHIWHSPAAVCLSIALPVGGPLRDRCRGISQSPAEAPGPPASVSGPTPRESRDSND